MHQDLGAEIAFRNGHETETARVPPNMRVKLAAPADPGPGFRPAGRFATILFVNVFATRRLRAFRWAAR